MDEAAHILGLTEWIDRKPGQLSGGQRQRVAMGRAIVREPAVFLMDEPLSNLDAKLRVQMRAEVSRIQQRLGAPTLYVTHDQTEAMTMGSRVAVMRSGLVEQCDTPQVALRPPGQPVRGRVHRLPGHEPLRGRRRGGRPVAAGRQPGDQPARGGRGEPPGGGRLPRPEGHHRAAPRAPARGRPADEPVLEGDVDLVEALGSELLVHFSIDAQRITTEGATEEEEQLTTRGAGVARIDTRRPMAPGGRGRFAVDVERMQLFDPRTELAIWD